MIPEEQETLAASSIQQENTSEANGSNTDTTVASQCVMTPVKMPEQIPVACSTPAALPPLKTDIVEIRGGRVVFQEPRLHLETHATTISDLAAFHEFTASLEAPMEVFPIKFYSLLAKYVQER